MVRAVVNHGLTKAAAARRFNTTVKSVAKRIRRFNAEGIGGLCDRMRNDPAGFANRPALWCFSHFKKKVPGGGGENMKRWLVIVGLLVVCIPDMAVAAGRTPSLLQQILSVFKPRPTPHYHHTATPKIESPRERPEEAVQPVRARGPAEAPQSVKASQPVEGSQPAMPTPAVEKTLPREWLIEKQAIKQAKPPIERALSVVAMRPDLFSEPAQTTQAIKQAKPANAMQAARAPMQVTQPIEPAQPLQAVKAVDKVPAEQPEPVSKPIPTMRTIKKGMPVAATQLVQTTQPIKPAQSPQVAILGTPNLKAALPAETAGPIEGPRTIDEPRVPPAKQETSSACNGGRRIVSAYYWEGRHTASGQPFNPHAMTAAHRTLPFGTHLNVTNPRTGKTVNVLINDRGPFVRGVSLDLSLGAAQAIGMHGTGSVCIP
jgi:rare lipoprotein A